MTAFTSLSFLQKCLCLHLLPSQWLSAFSLMCHLQHEVSSSSDNRLPYNSSCHDSTFIMVGEMSWFFFQDQHNQLQFPQVRSTNKHRHVASIKLIYTLMRSLKVLQSNSDLYILIDTHNSYKILIIKTGSPLCKSSSKLRPSLSIYLESKQTE